jgi:Tfp pilus assembly protein FimT
MQLIHKLLYRNRTRTGGNRLIRGLSTAELVGIIVVIGILGALGATYISGLVTTANSNTGDQNAVTLSTLANSYATGGGDLTVFGSMSTTPSDATTAVGVLNTGITDKAGISYQMTPNVNVVTDGAGNKNYLVSQSANGIVTFSHTKGDAP